MVRRLEGKHQEIIGAISGLGKLGLYVRSAERWPIQTGLADRSHAGDRLLIVAKAHRRRQSKRRSSVEPHPDVLGDHPQRALRAQEQPIGIFGRAPEFGSRRVAMNPAGVMTRRLSTWSSI